MAARETPPDPEIALTLESPRDPRSLRRAHAYGSRAGYALDITISKAPGVERYIVRTSLRVPAGWMAPLFDRRIRSIEAAARIAARRLDEGLAWLASRPVDEGRGAMPTDWTMRGAA